MAQSNEDGPLQHPAKRYIRQPSSRPLVTYGKKDTKLLSLTASQFRDTIYDLPKDDGQDQARESGSSGRGTPQPRASLEASEPSEAESVPKGVNNAPSAGPEKRRSQFAVQDTPFEAQREHSSNIKQQANPRKALKRQERPLTRPQKVTAAKSTTKTTPVHKSAAQRRLPVDELILVPSAVDDGEALEAPPTSPPAVEVQDPITDHASSPCKRSVSPSAGGDDQARTKSAKTPLTSLRTRLKAPPSIFRIVQRKKTLQRCSYNPRGHDGFDMTELKVVPLPRKKRKPRSSFASTFSALQLSNGPLPDVEFEVLAIRLKLKGEREDVEPEQENVHLG